MFELQQSITYSLRQSLSLLCSVCDQELGYNKDGTFLINIFGAAMYNKCPCCNQSTIDYEKDPVFKRKWATFVKKHIKKNLLKEGCSLIWVDEFMRTQVSIAIKNRQFAHLGLLQIGGGIANCKMQTIIPWNLA